MNSILISLRINASFPSNLLTAGISFFMHFSTEGRNEGDTARLESKIMTPTRDCKVQCLQFYYYHSGNESAQLNIWIRVYQNETDSRGTLSLMDQITGVSLYITKQFKMFDTYSMLLTGLYLFLQDPLVITGSCIM